MTPATDPNRTLIDRCIFQRLRCDTLPDFLGEPPDRITRTAHLVDDLGADDLDLAEIAAELSETLGLAEDFDGDKVATATTVNDLVRLATDAWFAAHADATVIDRSIAFGEAEQ